MTDIRLLYITVKDIDQARHLCRELVERRLVACANILPQMESIYRWNGELQTDQEVVVLLKTEARLVEAATRAILDLHTYETPCVLVLAVDAGSEGYVKWLRAQVTD